MTSRTYRCRGCHARLESAEDLDRLQGTTGNAWRCRVCKASVPGIVGERLKHRDP